MYKILIESVVSRPLICFVPREGCISWLWSFSKRFQLPTIIVFPSFRWSFSIFLVSTQKHILISPAFTGFTSRLKIKHCWSVKQYWGSINMNSVPFLYMKCQTLVFFFFVFFLFLFFCFLFFGECVFLCVFLIIMLIVFLWKCFMEMWQTQTDGLYKASKADNYKMI